MDSAYVASLAAALINLPSFFVSLLSDEFLGEVRKRENNRVYNTPVVMLLMIFQRLQAEGTLASTVLQLPALPASLWPDPCTRRQPGAQKISTNTGAYNKARQQLPLKAVEQFCDLAFEQLAARADGALTSIGRRAFLFDGTTIRTEHTKKLKELYPPATNHLGASHWPIVKILLAQDLVTGLGMRPVWGAVSGPNAVSEQSLFKLAVIRLPSGAIVVADANFGVFSVAHAAIMLNHPVLVRMTLARARKLLLQAPLRDGIDKRVTWRPSKADLANNPELKSTDCIHGRLIVTQVQPSDGKDPFPLCLFTTLEEDKDEIIHIYGQRWNVETDIAVLKGKLRVAHLKCTTPEMVNKEIEIAMLGYNLVRAIIDKVAKEEGIAPRRFSFTRVKNIINVYGPRFTAARTRKEVQTLETQMYQDIRLAKIPNRKEPRSYPRASWSAPKPFPRRKAYK